MISTNNIGLTYGGKKLFEHVTIKFTPGNCYGLIGANGSGKSTFLKLLSGEIETQVGTVDITPGDRISVLKQDHFQFDEFTVLHTVLMGNKKLYDVMIEKDQLYLKQYFSDADGIRASELETEFAEMNGWEAESEAATILAGLGLGAEYLDQKMGALTGSEKVKVLLAQALFGTPDILLLDEPTNHLDIKAITWLENFLLDFEQTVIVVSHDRHFLNKVCTHIADIDFGKITVYAGNYDFWRMSSELAQTLRSNQKKRDEEKAKELLAFIYRFRANVAKSKQATSRQKQLEKLQLDDLPVSSRKYPYVHFAPNREAGKDVLRVEGLSKTIDGVKLIDNLSFTINKGDKVIFLTENDLATTTLFQLLAGELEPDAGKIFWGVTITHAYLPRDNSKYFDGQDVTLLDWVRPYSPDQYETFLRGYLGKMLFSGDDALKKAHVLSGGERVRCMLIRMMLSGANVLLLDNPTSHLDLESITALNDGLIRFNGTILFTSHDHEFNQTVANRVIDLDANMVKENHFTYDSYLGLE
ncbi:putative ABC transporter, ATP-binding protein [Candidatus Moduliflexus flocculans]|uniref:Putative ABC transporter, ATP-binding protein n=1 Tax=Candidatus Moduliflexus flocculans TaxID=1499966 RepID=A0A0S6W2Y1_9BACT|nr:putative ABC transporter, ATP-binding protein [Candidatus Moduliflexus flocculans]